MTHSSAEEPRMRPAYLQLVSYSGRQVTCEEWAFRMQQAALPKREEAARIWPHRCLVGRFKHAHACARSVCKGNTTCRTA